MSKDIPVGWKTMKLGDLGKVVSGGTPDTLEPEFWNGSILWCTPSEITALGNNRFIEKTERKITQKGLDKSSAIILPENSLIVCTRATIGTLAINKVPMSTNQGFKSIVPNKKIDVLFLYYLLLTKKQVFLKLSIGSTFLELSKKDFCLITVEIPPLSEQQKIAAILSTWDRAIEKQEALIAVKKEYKKGMMQLLLTGQQRFPGFTEEWEEVRLGDVADSFSGGTPSRKKKEYYGGSIPWIKSGELNARKIYQTEEFITELGLKESAAKMVEKNTLLIAMYGATAGVCAITKVKGAINQAVLAIVPNENIDMLFLFQLILSKMPKVVLNMVQGGQPNLSGGIINSIKIIIPKLSEQQKIASFLSALDKEIEVLENELEAMRTQKWGLMQRLLTGEIRVKI